MKTLTVMRHCKSDWGNGDLSDHDRPLNARGRGDLPLIANRLNHIGFQVDACFHSSARRATDTTNGVNAYLETPFNPIRKEELYSFSGEVFFNFIQNLPDDLNQVLLVAHNPGLTELINYLGEINLDNLPTGGYCQFQFDIDHWADIAENGGDVKFLEYPKMFK